MAGPGLPVNIDSSYADDGSDVTVQLHQAHHDAIHAIVNGVDKDSLPTAPVLLAGITANNQTVSYQLVLSDAGKVIELNNAGAVNLTVPANATVAFPVGTVIEVWQQGAGQVTVVAGGGVTIRTPSTLLLRTQYSAVSLRKRATDEWSLAGDTT